MLGMLLTRSLLSQQAGCRCWLTCSLPAGRKHPQNQGWIFMEHPGTVFTIFTVFTILTSIRSILEHERRPLAGISYPRVEIPGLEFPVSPTSASCTSTGKQLPTWAGSLGTSGDTPAFLVQRKRAARAGKPPCSVLCGEE